MAIPYLLVVAATLAWQELSLTGSGASWARSSPPVSLIGLAGIGSFVVKATPMRFCPPTPCSPLGH